MRILVVEDQVELRLAIVRRLRAQGHGVDEAGDGETAEQLLAIHDHSVVVLDRMLADGDSIQRVREWRRRGCSVPVLLLTAKDELRDRVDGLEAGADDYLVKPFEMAELLARVSAVARRRSAPSPSMIVVGDVSVDTGRREVQRNGVLIPLRPKEFVLLELLARRTGFIVTHAEIIDACWDEAREPLSNVDEVLVASLRRKLGAPWPIRTVRGAGYLFEAVADER